jgi:hypothetical protein
LTGPVKGPFRKQCGSQMRGWHAGPVEDLLGNPVILGRVALRLTPCGNYLIGNKPLAQS